MLLISIVINRICLRLAYDEAINHVGTGGEIYFLDFQLRQFDQFTVVRSPESITLEAEILETIGTVAGIGNHLRRPRLVILDAAHLHTGIVNVNPIVSKTAAV